MIVSILRVISLRHGRTINFLSDQMWWIAPGGGGGGGTRLSTGRGVPLGGWKSDPVLNRSAHEKYTLS